MQDLLYTSIFTHSAYRSLGAGIRDEGLDLNEIICTSVTHYRIEVDWI